MVFTPGGFIMVPAFLGTTWTLQRVSQMEHEYNEYILHATYRFKIAICYRNKIYFSLRDRCP
jgi:hypothetical protein